jgi:hypothetical protein
LTSDQPVVNSRQVAFTIGSTNIAALFTSGRGTGCVVPVTKITLAVPGKSPVQDGL